MSEAPNPRPSTCPAIRCDRETCNEDGGVDCGPDSEHGRNRQEPGDKGHDTRRPLQQDEWEGGQSERRERPLPPLDAFPRGPPRGPLTGEGEDDNENERNKGLPVQLRGGYGRTRDGDRRRVHRLRVSQPVDGVEPDDVIALGEGDGTRVEDPRPAIDSILRSLDPARCVRRG